MNTPRYTLQEAAKLVGMGPKQLFSLLREQRVLDNYNLPYQRYIDRGLFTVHQGSFEHPSAGKKYYGRPKVTNKGLEWLNKLVSSRNGSRPAGGAEQHPQHGDGEKSQFLPPEPTPTGRR